VSFFNSKIKGEAMTFFNNLNSGLRQLKLVGMMMTGRCVIPFLALAWTVKSQTYTAQDPINSTLIYSLCCDTESSDVPGCDDFLSVASQQGVNFIQGDVTNLLNSSVSSYECTDTDDRNSIDLYQNWPLPLTAVGQALQEILQQLKCTKWSKKEIEIILTVLIAVVSILALGGLAVYLCVRAEEYCKNRANAGVANPPQVGQPLLQQASPAVLPMPPQQGQSLDFAAPGVAPSPSPLAVAQQREAAAPGVPRITNS
jgi:hypothetical protein